MSNDNVLKPFFTIFENESGTSREIDSNDLVEEKITEFRKKEEETRRRKEKERLENMTPEEREEYEQEQPDDLDGLFQDFDPEADDDGMSMSMDMDITNDLVNQAQEEADNILAEANARADEIMADATTTAESMKEQAIKEGQKQGYDMGQALATGEVETAKAEMNAEIERIRQEYIDKEIEMEKDVLDVVCDVMSKVFMIEFGDKKEILLHLCENAIANVESSKTLIIRVNENNKDYINENKEMIQDKVGENVQLDIVMDPLLQDDQCIIECDGGIIDCSIGVELDNFIKDLRALSI
ncbi:MAG: hypothetical protein K5644_06230 [Lachnospiraceae bacterium]|nr:hypothetical protein [Lachnospiraceae bacterium]